MIREQFRVQVPASTSNLGSGFDTISAALGLHLQIRVEVGSGSQIDWTTPWPAHEDNMVERALLRTLEAVGEPLPGLRLEMRNPIPLKRGLGSSGAAIIAGIKIAEHLWGGQLEDSEVLRLAHPLEGHPDNIAASLLGGWVLSRIDGEEVRSERIEAILRVRFVLAIPETRISTRQAREILPSSYSREDAVFNLQRCALLVHALHSDRADLLREALRDRLHQPYRAHLIPGLSDLLERRRLPSELESSLLGVALSGSGSAAAALASDRCSEIGEWMSRGLAEAGTRAAIEILDLDPQGARVELRTGSS